VPDLITDPDQLTAERLTQILRARGVLDRGEVIAVRRQSYASNTAGVAHLEVSYSDDRPPDAPTRLFLKLGSRRIEVEFYNLIAPAMPQAPVLRCYEAAFSSDAGLSHLLFDDLSTTHHVPEGALPPPLADTERMVDALAQVHAHWWQHPQLNRDIAAVCEDVPAYVVGVAKAAFSDFVDLLGDRLSDERRAVYERLFAVWPPPGLAERRATGQAMTLIHGDTHFWNFLVPRSPDADQVRIMIGRSGTSAPARPTWPICSHCFGFPSAARAWSEGWSGATTSSCLGTV
jgi:hypothetical protein